MIEIIGSICFLAIVAVTIGNVILWPTLAIIYSIFRSENNPTWSELLNGKEEVNPPSNSKELLYSSELPITYEEPSNY